MVPTNIKRLQLAGLLPNSLSATMKSQRVLDVGSGPGYFVQLARAAGHDAVGIEPASCHLRSEIGDRYFPEIMFTIG